MSEELETSTEAKTSIDETPVEQTVTIHDSDTDTSEIDNKVEDEIAVHSLDIPIPLSSPQSLVSDSSIEEEEEDDEVESEMLRKLDKDIYGDILLKYHPEIKQNNYNDILAMCKVVRDSKGIITDVFHKTLPWLTKYERARVLGLRSKQLNNGADAFIEVPPSMISGYKIAIEELYKKKIPFIIRRPIPNGGTEYWKLEDLELLNSY